MLSNQAAATLYEEAIACIAAVATDWPDLDTLALAGSFLIITSTDRGSCLPTAAAGLAVCVAL